MILQALDIVIILIIAITMQTTVNSVLEPPETYVDPWELRLWNSIALRTNHMTKVIGFILIMGNC